MNNHPNNTTTTNNNTLLDGSDRPHHHHHRTSGATPTAQRFAFVNHCTNGHIPVPDRDHGLATMNDARVLMTGALGSEAATTHVWVVTADGMHHQAMHPLTPMTDVVGNDEWLHDGRGRLVLRVYVEPLHLPPPSALCPACKRANACLSYLRSHETRLYRHEKLAMLLRLETDQMSPAEAARKGPRVLSAHAELLNAARKLCSQIAEPYGQPCWGHDGMDPATRAEHFVFWRARWTEAWIRGHTAEPVPIDERYCTDDYRDAEEEEETYAYPPVYTPEHAHDAADDDSYNTTPGHVVTHASDAAAAADRPADGDAGAAASLGTEGRSPSAGSVAPSDDPDVTVAAGTVTVEPHADMADDGPADDDVDAVDAAVHDDDDDDDDEDEPARSAVGAVLSTVLGSDSEDDEDSATAGIDGDADVNTAADDTSNAAADEDEDDEPARSAVDAVLSSVLDEDDDANGGSDGEPDVNRGATAARVAELVALFDSGETHATPHPSGAAQRTAPGQFAGEVDAGALVPEQPPSEPDPADTNDVPVNNNTSRDAGASSTDAPKKAAASKAAKVDGAAKARERKAQQRKQQEQERKAVEKKKAEQKAKAAKTKAAKAKAEEDVLLAEAEAEAKKAEKEKRAQEKKDARSKKPLPAAGAGGLTRVRVRLTAHLGKMERIAAIFFDGVDPDTIPVALVRSKFCQLARDDEHGALAACRDASYPHAPMVRDVLKHRAAFPLSHAIRHTAATAASYARAVRDDSEDLMLPQQLAALLDTLLLAVLVADDVLAATGYAPCHPKWAESLWNADGCGTVLHALLLANAALVHAILSSCMSMGGACSAAIGAFVDAMVGPMCVAGTVLDLADAAVRDPAVAETLLGLGSVTQHRPRLCERALPASCTAAMAFSRALSVRPLAPPAEAVPAAMVTLNAKLETIAKDVRVRLVACDYTWTHTTGGGSHPERLFPDALVAAYAEAMGLPSYDAESEHLRAAALPPRRRRGRQPLVELDPATPEAELSAAASDDDADDHVEVPS